MDIKTTAKDFVNSKDYLSKLSEDEKFMLIIDISLLLVNLEIDLKMQSKEGIDKLINDLKNIFNK